MLLIEGRIAKHDRSNWPSLSSTWPTFFSTLSIFFMIATKNTSYSQKVGIQVPLSLMPPWRWGNIDQVKDVIKLGGGFAPLNRTPPPPPSCRLLLNFLLRSPLIWSGLQHIFILQTNQEMVFRVGSMRIGSVQISVWPEPPTRIQISSVLILIWLEPSYTLVWPRCMGVLNDEIMKD